MEEIKEETKEEIKEINSSESFKICPHCNIKVGGQLKKCPLCQTPLRGEGTPDYWPKARSLKTQSLFFRILFFILISLLILMAGTKFLIIDYPNSELSILVIFLALALTFLAWYLWKYRPGLARMIFIFMISAFILSSFMDYHMHWNWITVRLVFPILISAALVINFIITLVKSNVSANSLIYLMVNILLGVVPYIALLFLGRKGRAPWTICLLISIVTLVGLLIFKRSAFMSELQKRFHV